MKSVEFLKNRRIPNIGDFAVGDVRDVPDWLAHQLIASGVARDYFPALEKWQPEKQPDPEPDLNTEPTEPTSDEKET